MPRDIGESVHFHGFRIMIGPKENTILVIIFEKLNSIPREIAIFLKFREFRD